MAVVLLAPGVLSGVGACAAENRRCSLRPGTDVREIEVAGATRRYWLSAGSRLSDAAAPLVFLWHGWGGQAQHMLRALELTRLWPEAIFVAPEGMSRIFPGLGSTPRPGWQIEPGEFGDRDVELFDAILAALQAEGCADSGRVFSTGFSNGGFFSNLLGCVRGDVLAAIAPVSGGGPGGDSCPGGMAAMITHGRSDGVVSYRQGERSFRIWSEINGCEEGTAPVANACVEARACREPVRLCTFDGGHSWPNDLTPHIVEFLQTNAN